MTATAALRERVGRMAGLGALTTERLAGETLPELVRSAVDIAGLYGGQRYAEQVKARLEDAIASWATTTGGSKMPESTYQQLRERVAKDAGLPRSAAATFRGETLEVVAREALEYARERRGEGGVKDVMRAFAAADLVESSDAVRARVARDLDLSPELRVKLSRSTTTEAQVVDDALALLRESEGPAALDAGVRRLQNLAMDGLMRDSRGSSATLVDADDMNALIRAAVGRDTDES